MNWDHAVSWSRGVWVSVSDIGRVGSGWPLDRVGQPAAAAPGVEKKPNQRRTQNQPTRYYDQAPAMNWDHAVSWGRGFGLALAILVGLGRVGQPELKQSPQATRGKKNICCAVN